MSFVTEQIPMTTGATSVYPYSAALESAFMVTPKFEPPYSMAKREGNLLFVPRGMVPLGSVDYRISYNRLAIDCQIVPFDKEQEQCINASTCHLKSGRNHILNAPTGWGKTFAGVSIACKLGQPTLIIVTKEDLIKSWKKAIRAAGIPDSEVGVVQGPKCQYKGKQFVIGMVHSVVIPDKYPEDFFKYFGFVIFDEVHRMAAETFSIAAGLFPAYYRLGLSATTYRQDGKWPVIEGHIGKVLVEGKLVPMKPKILVKKTGWKPPKCNNTIQTAQGWKTEFGPMKITPGRMMDVFKVMGEDYARNKHIVDFVVSCYNKGRHVVVMADIIDGHLKPLFHALAKAGIPGNDMGFYISGLKEQELEANAHKRVVLATFKMCSEGTDYANWDALVLCNPHADIKQAIGRILRRKEGKPQPVALELWDEVPILSNFYYSRLKQYHAIGADIVHMD